MSPARQRGGLLRIGREAAVTLGLVVTVFVGAVLGGIAEAGLAGFFGV